MFQCNIFLHPQPVHSGGYYVFTVYVSMSHALD